MDWKSTGSAFATLMFLKTIPTLLPPDIYDPIRNFLHDLTRSLNLHNYLRSFNPTITISVDQFDQSGYTSDIYDLVQSYLSSKSAASARSITMSRSKNSTLITYSLSLNDTIQDTFDGFTVTWSYHSSPKPASNGVSSVSRSFHLTFHDKHRHRVQAAYLPHVLEEAAAIRFKSRERKLYTNKPMDGGSLWTSIPFAHPTTFDTLAIDPVLKEEIKEDLLKFVGRRDYYARVGRTWKRGYLLHGPPGTGKTSLIAAIANFLDFDIYDLELTAVRNNSHLRRLLVSTSTKSVIVVEDVDCTVEAISRRGTKRTRDGTEVTQSVSLSGVLNFVDGLWSSCGGERIMVFTTNHKDHLDPALLRPGRMDKHINMGYCGLAAFRVLAKNYLGIEEHDLMKEVEEILPTVQMTPADVAEVLMGCEDDPDQGMRSVVETIRKRCRWIETAASQEEEMEKEVDKKVKRKKMEKMKGQAKGINMNWLEGNGNMTDGEHDEEKYEDEEDEEYDEG